MPENVREVECAKTWRRMSSAGIIGSVGSGAGSVMSLEDIYHQLLGNLARYLTDKVRDKGGFQSATRELNVEWSECNGGERTIDPRA